MTVSITTRADKGAKLLTTEVDDNFLAGKAAIEALQSTVASITDAATDTAIADTSIGKVMLDIAGVPKKISVDNLVAAISTPASGLAVAAALSGSDIITISQDGGSTEVRTTLAALAAFLGAAPVAATGFTLTGPTSGVNGVASSNFTIGVTGGSTLTGTVTVTPSDSGAGGTFTPTSRAMTTSNLTATFAYTPASTGAKTISITNNGSLTNPSNITYTASASATVPGAPTGVTATAGNASASVAFTAPSDGGSAITGYTVTSSPGGFTGTGSVSPINVTGLTNGTPYTFTMTATNDIGTSAASSPSSAVTPSAGSTVPGQVTGLTLGTATSTTQPLTWADAASTGGQPKTDFTIQWSPAGANTWTSFTHAASTANAITVTGLTASTSYDYRVAQVNSIGTGAFSSTATGSTAASATPAYLFAPTAYSFATGGVISVSGYWGGGSTIYVKTAGGVTPANVKMAWGTSPTVPPAQHSDTSVGGHANAIMPCVRTGGWVQGGATSQGFYGLYAPNGSLFAFGAAGTYYLWVLTDDGFSKAYDNNTGTPIGVVLT